MKKQKKGMTAEEKAYNKGYKAGILHGYEFAVVLSLLVLKDKHGAGNEDIAQFNSELKNYVEAVRSGNFKFNDMKHVLQDEYHITFEWR